MSVAVLRIQCDTKEDGERGDFLCDSETGATLTPVFTDLGRFFEWAAAEGWVRQPRTFPIDGYPTGVYAKEAP